MTQRFVRRNAANPIHPIPLPKQVPANVPWPSCRDP